MRVEGSARATRAAQLRVIGAVDLLQKAGVPPFEAAATAIAAETGKPLEEARAWLEHQRTEYLSAKAKLEARLELEKAQ